MNTLPNELIQCLRDELEGYGEMLALYDGQQEHLWRRDADAITADAMAIEKRAREIQAYRNSREAWLRRFAVANGMPETTGLREMLSFFDPDIRPLLDALITDINNLIHRVRRRARQNHNLISWTLKLQQEALSQLAPQTVSPLTYASDGRMPAPTTAVLDALG
ncbi:flagellar protein FlgN [Termitidicoccus mucosus]|uniref:flagellar protein FlgN n=1 Tax=Termitidicoccus mucosus TaxID=1184151 RepID=UPI000838703D